MLYALQGELFTFILSFLVALQHECAHAFASSRLGYKLNKIILMPFGAVIDGDMRGLSLKDEIIIALWGPLCNLLTALFFASIWWFAPTMYAFTDTAYQASLSIALVNLLPAYPLDGGRILRCVLVKVIEKYKKNPLKAEKIAEKITQAVTVLFALALLVLFFLYLKNDVQWSLLFFVLFLLVGALDRKKDRAVYARMDFSCTPLLRRGAEIKRIALFEDCPIKDAFRYFSRGYYLVFEVYDKNENKRFDVSQNQLAVLFTYAKSPYECIGACINRVKKSEEKVVSS
jgi:stage IV sporulation protein FB